MKSFIALLLLSTTFSFGSDLQDAFRFHEAYLLERQIGKSGEEYEGARSASYAGLATPSPAQQFVVDPNNPISYRDENRLAILISQIDYMSQGGRRTEAEKQYHTFLIKLREAQGPNSIDEAFVLDHIGEFYLKMRDFDVAYKRFGDAVKIGRTNIAAASPAILMPLRLHLADMLTSMGELDLARGEALTNSGGTQQAKQALDSAERELSEAVAIDNEPGYRTYVNRLDGPYFDSLLLEHQKRWTEAEAMWQQTVTSRAKMGNQPYWDAMKEMAAFEARKGDFHAAAKLASQMPIGEAAKQMKTAASAPYWIESRAIGNTWFIYEAESNLAMREILAVDMLMSKGADTAAPMLKTPINEFMLDRGDDSDRLRYLSWLSDKASLHLSILLDRGPSSERIAEAFALVGSIQGRYLAATAAATAILRSEVGNPHIQDPHSGEPAQLADVRERRAHLFVTEQVDGRPIDPSQYSAAANEELALTDSMVATVRSHGRFLSPLRQARVADNLAKDTALVNFVAWNRLDKSHPEISHREYGAFVLRKGFPIQYVQIGAPDTIDQQIEALGRQAEEFLNGSGGGGDRNVLPILRDLYQKVLKPIEPALSDARSVLIVPDGSLALVPFEALVDGRGDFFLKSHVVSYLTSWRDVLELSYEPERLEAEPKSPPLVLANPDFDMTLAASEDPVKGRIHFGQLAGAQTEASYVQSALGLPSGRVLSGKDAREGIVEAVAAPEILHFATHSEAHIYNRSFGKAYDLFEFPGPSSTQNPLLLAVIALAGANRPQEGLEDGLLTGLEVASLNLLGTRLVVLSSCQSGSGTTVDGQGVIGLRTAFLLAGARSLVMNIWPVSDEAGPVFMKAFYQHLKDNSVSEAVRLAQLDLMTSSQFKNPLYWAGYAQTGIYDGNSVSKSQTPAAQVTSHDIMVPPACYEISGRGAINVVNRFKLRIKIGGTVERKQVSPDTVVYDLDKPGNEIELASDYEPPWRSSEHSPVSLRLERTRDHSGIYIDAGHTTKLSVVLEGDANLFRGFDLPPQLPPKSSYKKLSIVHSRVNTEVIDYIGFCGADAP